jgi:hypothetical protein
MEVIRYAFNLEFAYAGLLATAPVTSTITT